MPIDALSSFTTNQIIYGLLAGMLPPLLWLWFWMKENNLHPEPRKILLGCFLVGMCGVILAAPLQYMVAHFFHLNNNYQYIIWAAIEEIIKFGAAFLVAFRLKVFTEPIDGMIFMITSALGFAALENTLFMLGIINTSDITSSIINGNWRFLGAVLLHSVVSAVVGFMIALSFYRGKFVKFISVIIGLCIATALHASFNLTIISAVTKIDKLRALGLVWVRVIFLIILFQEIKAFEIRGDAEHKHIRS